MSASTVDTRSSLKRGGKRPKASSRPQKGTWVERLAPAWLVGPAGLVLLAVTFVPLFFLVFTSFTSFDQRSLFTGEYEFVGLQQYTSTLADKQFWSAAFLTLWFTVALVAGSMVLGLIAAELLARTPKVMRYVLTFALIFAWGMPNVASAQVWNWMFQPQYGVANWMVTQLRLFGDQRNLVWGDHTLLALLCIWMLVVWQAVPFIAFTTYAARTQVDPSLLEAARLDGASELRTYFTIILNYLKPTIMLLTILSIIWDFNVFNQIWLVTQGGPDGTTATLGIWTYLTAFNQFKVGKGAAIAVLTTLMLIAMSSYYIRRLLRSGEDL